MRYHLRALGPLLGALVLLSCKSDDSSTPGDSSPDGGSPDGGENAVGPSGHFFGPVGSKLDLSIGADTVSPPIDEPSAPAGKYGSTRFAFRDALADGASYSVVAGDAPENQTCRVYQGESGSAPIAEDTLRAGCEWTYDLLSRSSDDTVKTGADYSREPGFGGDGRFVAFRSKMVGLPGNLTETYHVSPTMETASSIIRSPTSPAISPRTYGTCSSTSTAPTRAGP